MAFEEAYAWWRAGEASLAGVAGRSKLARRAAAQQLRRAHDLATRLPAAPLLEEIKALARSARLDLAEPTLHECHETSEADDLGLTPRERVVLELLASGMSNGQIGEQLFIARKTASVHVSNILRKLSVRNRIEAAAVVHRLQPRA